MSEEDTRSRNSEAKFASPNASNEGIDYYDEEGNPLTAKEFQQVVARDARLRDEEDDG